MGMTVQQLIDRVQIDFPDQSEAECLSDLQSVYDELSFDYKLSPSTAEISLTAGTGEYALPAGVTRVFEARYVSSASSATVLVQAHTDWLDNNYPGWRSHDSGTPRYCYAEAGNIGLYPKPSETTSGSYPKVHADVTTRIDLGLSDDLPSLADYGAFVDGVKAAICARTNDSRYPVYKDRHESGVRRLSIQVQRFNARYSQPLWSGDRTGGRS